MSHASHRITATPLLLLAAGAALSLTACFTPPPMPTAGPEPTTTTVDPVETSTTPTTPEPTTAEPTSAPDGDIPDLVAMGTELPAGTIGGWETSILTDDAFMQQDDSTFPGGPTISVVETATDCTFWAYQGTQDSDSTDEAENSAETLSILSNSTPDDWDPDIFTLDASASQGAAVEMLSIIQEPEDGSAQGWFARNFQSGGMTSSIMAQCPAGGGGIDHIDEVVSEHFQINFLVP